MNFDESFVQTEETRSQGYRFLASVYFRELDESQIRFLKDAALPAESDTDMERMSHGIRRYFRRAAPDVLTRLRVDYARIFLAAGVYEGETAVPYESVFTGEERLMMGEARDDVLARYRREGMAVDPGLRTPEDHIAFELEFMALLCDKVKDAANERDGAEVTRLYEVQREFLDEHLLNWIEMLASKVDEYAKEEFYPLFCRYSIEYLKADRAFIIQELEG